LGRRFRSWIQFAAALIQNANFRGFFTGKLYQGAGKNACVPGLNCYSCPGAVASCPIGALQSFLANRPIKIPYYVMGLLFFFGVLFGRAVCGFLCPFGFLQELLHKIPFPRRKPRRIPGDRPLRYLKYLSLLGTVLLLPMLLARTPFFCKYICPVGTLEGGVPLVLFHAGSLQLSVGPLFFWKAFLLLAVLAASLLLYRPFCKYLCPLGAYYGLFNGVSLYRLHLDTKACIHCGKCAQACRMQVDPAVAPGSPECIRCGACAAACPTSALRMGFAPEKHCAAVQKQK